MPARAAATRPGACQRRPMLLVQPRRLPGRIAVDQAVRAVRVELSGLEEGKAIMSSDPLLQPYRLKHLVLRNRLMSRARVATLCRCFRNPAFQRARDIAAFRSTDTGYDWSATRAR